MAITPNYKQHKKNREQAKKKKNAEKRERKESTPVTQPALPR
jgi:hypothetical protein